MARGLGAIMAEVKMAEARDRIERGDSIVCPVCGAEMEFNGCAWFCMGRGDNMPPDLKEAAEGAGYDPLAYYDHDGGVGVVAAVVDGCGNIRVTLTPARDHGRFGGWRVGAVELDDKDDVPALVKRFGWTWMEWVPSRFGKCPHLMS